MHNKIVGLKKRYGFLGVLENIFQKTLSYIGVVCHRKLCLVFKLECLTSDIKESNNDYKVASLSYSDFDKYGDRTWFNTAKLTHIYDRFKNPNNIALGIIVNGQLASSGWITINDFSTIDVLHSKKIPLSVGYLWDDYTAENFRGIGLHKLLIHSRLEFLKKAEFKDAISVVDAYNKASLGGFLKLKFIRHHTFFIIKFPFLGSVNTFNYE